MTNIGNIFRGIIGLICGIGLLAVVLLNPITTSVIGGAVWAWNHNRSIGDSYSERNFAEVCPEYKAASTWDRWFNDRMTRISWCSDYIDRL